MDFHGEGAVPELVGLTSFQDFYITPFTAGFCRWLYFTSGMSSPPKRGGKHILEILDSRFGYQQVDISKKVTTHPWSTPQAIPLPNYVRIPFTTCW